MLEMVAYPALVAGAASNPLGVNSVYPDGLGKKIPSEVMQSLGSRLQAVVLQLGTWHRRVRRVRGFQRIGARWGLD